ncbi:MAG TPA: hypothetical protein VKA30_05645, partial [Actinomycetota bacterium]|nr:hypothetical protein [Actinomycetota bacterium]
MKTQSRPERQDTAGDADLSGPAPSRSGLLFCLKAFVGARVLLTLLGLIAVAVLPHVPPGGADAGALGQVPGPVGVPGWPAHEITSGWHNVFLVWERFDALWFLRVAASGYRATDGSLAFFPLFPLLARWVGVAVGGHPLAGGLIVSNAAAFGAT